MCFWSGEGNYGKGILSTWCPYTINVLWNGIDQGKCQAVDHFLTAMGKECASDGALERHVYLWLRSSLGKWRRLSLNMCHPAIETSKQDKLRITGKPLLLTSPWVTTCNLAVTSGKDIYSGSSWVCTFRLLFSEEVNSSSFFFLGGQNPFSNPIRSLYFTLCTSFKCDFSLFSTQAVCFHASRLCLSSSVLCPRLYLSNFSIFFKASWSLS